MLNNIYLIIGIMLGLLNIYQLLIGHKERESVKSIIRGWQNQAEGIKNALLGIVYSQQNFSTTEDMKGAIQAISQSAVSLDKAMTEERFYTDKEVKNKKTKSEEEMKELLKPRS